jgi:hypothetical protein
MLRLSGMHTYAHTLMMCVSGCSAAIVSLMIAWNLLFKAGLSKMRSSTRITSFPLFPGRFYHFYYRGFVVGALGCRGLEEKNRVRRAVCRRETVKVSRKIPATRKKSMVGPPSPRCPRPRSTARATMRTPSRARCTASQPALRASDPCMARQSPSRMALPT